MCIITNTFIYCIAFLLNENAVEISESLLYGRKEKESGFNAYNVSEIMLCVLLAFSQVPALATYYTILSIFTDIKMRYRGAESPRHRTVDRARVEAKTSSPTAYVQLKMIFQ